MQHTFTHKLILVIVAGFFVASVYVFFYRRIIADGDKSINGGYQSRYGISAPGKTPAKKH